jgi:hypothetical protein
MHCNDAECAGDDEAVNPVYTTENVADLSFTLDSTGNPVISFYTYSTFDLHVVHCNDAACADGDDQAVSADVAGDVGDQSSVAVDGSGNPVVSYVDKTNGAVKVLHCGDANCASSVEVGGIAALSGMDSPTENGSGILVLVFTAVAAAIGLAGVALIGRRRVA